MLQGIFVESTTEQGLLYDRYKSIPDVVEEFMDDVDDAINHANKIGVDDAEKLDLSGKLEKFKSDIRIEMGNPKSIDIKSIKSTRNEIKSTKDKVLRLLSKLGAMHKKTRFGDNYIKGVLLKPKIFHDTIDDETHEVVNAFTRQIGRSLDWIEKIILDLMNLVDQDLNLLSLVSAVYYRKIFENVEYMMTESNDLSMELMEDNNIYQPIIKYNGLLDEPLEEDGDNYEGPEIDNILNHQVKEEVYYPVFPISISYDYDYHDQKMVSTGHNIHNITNGDEYTHSLIAFDPSLEQLYHFQLHGMEITSIYEYPSVQATKSIYIAVVFVTKEERDQIMKVLDDYLHDIDNTKYDFLGFVYQVLGKHTRVNKAFLCSTFVGYLLNIANKKNLPRDYSEYRPGDVTILPRSFFLMTFKNVDDFRERGHELRDRLNKIYNDNIDEIREYNNILPKVILDDNIKEAGSIRKFLWRVLDKFGV